jgi:hypothetical protein
MAPFDAYTLLKARDAIPRETDSPYIDETSDGTLIASHYSANKRLYDGDHWMDSGGWIGPRPGVGEDQSVLLEIRRAFISKNVIREVVDRHVAGVIGQEPSWRFALRRPLGKIEVEEEVPAGDKSEIDEETGRIRTTIGGRPSRKVKTTVDEQPTEQEQALLDEAEAVLTEFWDERGMHGILQDLAKTLLLAGRAIPRLFVPSGLLVNGRVPRADLAQSLGRIYLHAPDPTQATVITDSATQQQAGVYVYSDDDKADRAELVALDDNGRTVIRILGTDAEAAAEPLDLGGRLTMYEMKRAALITPQVRQQQYLLNMACTMMGRNVVLAGFLERILLNVQLPGVYEGEGTARRFVPDTFRVGAGTTNALMGATYTDEQGITRMATPSVVYRDPVPVVTFKDTKLDAYMSILEETDQLHALISGDATASGESRKQARADFEMSLLDTQAQINRAGRWLLETLLAMAAAFAGQPGRFNELRAVFECRIDAGPMSSDDQTQVRENVMAGLLSEETGMARIGVDDVDSEKERIASEREARMSRAPQIAPAPVTEDEADDDALAGALDLAQRVSEA